MVKCETEILDGGKFDQRRRLIGKLMRVTFGKTIPCTKPYGFAVPLPIFHGHLRHGVGGGLGRRRPSALVERGQRNSHPALSHDTVLNVCLSGRYFTHIAVALSELCQYPMVSAPQRHWGSVPVLEGLPLPLLDGGNIPLYIRYCLPGRHFINLRTFRKV